MTTSKLRIDMLDENTTTRELHDVFKAFGKVREVSIHQGGHLIYALVTMSTKDAERAYFSEDDAPLKIRGRSLRLSMANRSREPWLSHDWRPPNHRNNW